MEKAKPKYYMKLRNRNKVTCNSSRDGEMIHFGVDKYLVRFGPYLHLFVAKNNSEIYRKGCVSHQLFDCTSLLALVRALKKRMFIENNSYCVGSIYLAPLSNCAKKICLAEDFATKDDEDPGFEGYRITDTVVKGERNKTEWNNPAVEHLIQTVNSPLVIIDSKGEAYYTNKKGYAVIDYLPSMSDTIIVALAVNKKEIAVTTVEEYDSVGSCVKLGPAKGHLLMTSAISLDSAPFQVLFTCDEALSAATSSRKSFANLIRPHLFCALNDCCLIQFGGKVYLLGNKVNDSKPVALIKLSANVRQSISILQINELIKQNCFELCEQVFIGKQSDQQSDDTVMLKKLDNSAVIMAKDQSFLLNIAEIIETLLTVTNDELKPKTICFGDIVRTALIIDVNAEGKLTDFEYGCKQSKLQSFIECRKQLADESESKPRIELKAQMMTTDSKRDKRKYPLDISANKHTISLDRNAILYVRGSACNGVVKLERKGIAFVTGYLIIITDKGGTVCQPNQIKIIQIEAGQHLLQCGQNGHILFVGCGGLLVFNPFNVDEDPIISYFEKITNNASYESYVADESDSEDDMSDC